MYSNITSGNYNIRKGFINPNSMTVSQFNPALDEPTYLSFKLNFYSDEEITDNMSYDSLPQGLFTYPDEIAEWSSDSELRQAIQGYSSPANVFQADKNYSAVRYLLDRNEDFRAFLLLKFLKGWNELQEQYQYYFQSVSGLDELFKNTPDSGMKIAKDATITIECLEGIDQKVKYLLSLYRSAAWDDEYQRWILPDIYRFFKMDIYISEIRTFHQSFASDNGSAENLLTNTATNLINKGLGNVSNLVSKVTSGGVNNNTTIDTDTLSILNGIAPVTCIHCEMCDLDVNGNLYAGSYNINNSDAEKTTFKVKVKKAEIIYNWTLIDRIFGNLFSTWERGKSAISAENGWRDYLGDSVLSQQSFNVSDRMSEADKLRNYSGTITQGWMADAATGLVDSLNKAGSVLDLAADLYNNIRSSVAAAKKQAEANKESVATTSNKTAADFQINLIGANPANTTLIAEATSIIAESEIAKNERQQNAIDLLKNLGSQFQDLASETQKNLQDAINSLNITSMVGVTEEDSNKDRSWATELDGNQRDILPTTIDGSLSGEMEMVSMEDIRDRNSQYDRSWATELDDKENQILPVNIDGSVAAPMNMVSMVEIKENNSNKDRSWATELDGNQRDIKTVTIDGSAAGAMDMTSMVSPRDLNSNYDRSWATELDGLQRGVTSITIDGSVPSAMDMTSMVSPRDLNSNYDRSWATELDGSQRPITSITIDGSVAGEMNMISMVNPRDLNSNFDRSWATELDGLNNNKDLVGITPTELNLSMIDVQIQTVDDRSWATDLDGGPNEIIDPGTTDEDGDEDGTGSSGTIYGGYINSDIDRSTATELDGGPYYDKLTEIEGNTLGLNLTAPEINGTEPNNSLNSVSIINNNHKENSISGDVTPNILGSSPNYNLNNTPLIENNLKENKIQGGTTPELIGNSPKTNINFGEFSGYNPNLNIDTKSLFEQIAESQATNRDRLGYETPVLKNIVEPNKNLVILSDGQINPKATVQDIIQQYTDVYFYNKAKSTSLEDNMDNTKSMLVGNSPTKSTISTSQMIDNSKHTQTILDPNGYKNASDNGTRSNRDPKGYSMPNIKGDNYKPTLKDVRLIDNNLNLQMQKTEISDKKVKKNTKTIL